jgi:hypothetical protein
MPVFEGLLPQPFDDFVQDLLFDLAMWHAYAKLRMHTETTLSDFEVVITSLGQQLRRFAAQTCAQFKTKETPAEVAARGRRVAAKKAKAIPAESMTAKMTKARVAVNSKHPKKDTSDPKIKKFNLRTYKLHALGDYPNTIRMFGTTDSYSTQIVKSSFFMVVHMLTFSLRVNWSIVV